jgi:hypothetical protein
MVKKLLCLAIALALIFAAVPGGAFAADAKVVKVYLNSELMEFDVPPKILNGRTLVPLRFIAEKLGAEVTWDDESRTAKLVKDGDTILVAVGDNTMYVNDRAITLDVPPTIVNNRTLVPLRAIAESFQIDVDWIEREYAVIITSEPLFGEYESEDFSLLSGRLNARLPGFSVDEAMQSSIMGPESSSEEITRIIIEKSGEKLVLYVAELFLQSSGDLAADAKAIFITEYGRDGVLGAPVESGGVSSVILTPDVYDGRDGISLCEALISTRDGLLVYASVLASPETFAKKYECIKEAQRIIGSITAGERVIDRTAHVDTTMHGFEIALARDYVLTYEQGIDFDVYFIQKIVKPGERQPYMGIYTGRHPSYHEEENAALSPGKILGQDVVWHIYNAKADVIAADSYIDTLLSSGEGVSMSYVHIFAYPATPEAWAELRASAESLTAKP